MLQFLAPVYLGWSLGANDASNVFGGAVAARMLRFGTAGLLAAAFVLLGALLEGERGMRTLGGLSDFDLSAAVVASLGAALAVTLLTVLRLPVSTSQAVVGAILGVGVLRGGVDLSGLGKVVLCWVGTPLGALVAAVVVYVALRPLVRPLAHQIIAYDIVLRGCLVVAGCYAAYALGANNVANVTGVFVGAGALSTGQAALIGGASIGAGILTYGKPVMRTVGRGITRLDAFGALVVALAQAVTVHVYAVIGVPVSTSQAVVGAALGVGLLKGVETVRARGVLGILSGWLATPPIAAVCAIAVHFVSQLRFAG